MVDKWVSECYSRRNTFSEKIFIKSRLCSGFGVKWTEGTVCFTREESRDEKGEKLYKEDCPQQFVCHERSDANLSEACMDCVFQQACGLFVVGV